MATMRKKTNGRRTIGYVAAAILVLGASFAVASPASASGGPGAAGSRTTAADTIPAAAFLQPADLGGAETAPASPELRPFLRPPQPCTKGTFPGTRLRRASGAVSAMVAAGENRPTVVLEYIATYRANGARLYLRALRRAVTRCGGCADATGRWSLVGTGVAGGDSLLLRLEQPIEDYGGNIIIQTTYLAVMRVGRAVVVLADLGWETGSGHEAIVRDLAPAARHRAWAAD